MNTLPTIETYGRYTSSNYGAHALCVSVGELDIYFSYRTPVAFRTPQTGLVCRVNDWKQTTGKHLNAIEPDHKKRISGEQFEATFKQVLTDYNLSL